MYTKVSYHFEEGEWGVGGRWVRGVVVSYHFNEGLGGEGE